jgi:hypothetical protein
MQRRKTLPTLLALALGLLIPGVATAEDGLGAVLPDYEQIRQALVNDSLAGVAAPAASLRETVESLSANLSAARAGVPAAKLSEVESLLPEVIEAARALETAESLDAARDAFYALSKPLVRWRQAAEEGPAVAFCPMAKRSWLQPGDQEIRNPYLGKDMSNCGRIVSK